MNESELAGCLAAREDFWRHWGFAPWHRGPLAGVARRQRFVKDGLLGRVAEYGAWDYIVWQTGVEPDRQALWAGLKPRPDIMTQRFLLLRPEPRSGRRIRSFWFGFRGYAELYEYWPQATPPTAGHFPADLTGLVELALRMRETPPAPGPGGLT